MSKLFIFKPGVCYELQGAVYEVGSIFSNSSIVVKNITISSEPLSSHSIHECIPHAFMKKVHLKPDFQTANDYLMEKTKM